MKLARNFEEDERPRVSVVTLLYTGYGKYLHESLGSLARQTYRDFEVILVNDGSEDDTPQVAREMMERYRGKMRVSLLDLPHQGIPASRNAGFNMARGDYYLNFDADDMLSERFLEIGAAYLDEHPETDVVYFPYQNFEGDTSFFMPPEFDRYMLKYWNFVLNQSLYRKKMFHVLGGYLVGKTVYDDWDFWLRAARHGFSFKRLTGAYMLYRRHVASITARARSHGENAAPVWFANRESYDPCDLEWARKVLDEERQVAKQEIWNQISEGEIRPGRVKSLTDFGAFIDLGGVDGLLHVSELSWGRVQHPSQVLQEGQEIQVKVLRLDRERGRISLGLKQVLQNPWEDIDKTYPEGSIVIGKVVRLATFGAFVELAPGIDGLIHVSQLSDEHVTRPSEVVQVGDEVRVKVLRVDPDQRRVSLSLREGGSVHAQAEENRPQTEEPATIADMVDDDVKKDLLGE